MSTGKGYKSLVFHINISLISYNRILNDRANIIEENDTTALGNNVIFWLQTTSIQDVYLFAIISPCFTFISSLNTSIAKKLIRYFYKNEYHI